jgi:hypothetical protein
MRIQQAAAIQLLTLHNHLLPRTLGGVLLAMFIVRQFFSQQDCDAGSPGMNNERVSIGSGLP